MDQRLLDALAGDDFSRAPALLEPLFDLVRVMRKIGDGDIDKLLIMSVVGLRTLAHPVFKTRPHQQVLAEETLIPTLGVNSRSLAETLPIARETVRRKVSELIAAGWLVRQGHNLHITVLAVREMEPFRAEMHRLAAAYFELVSDAVEAKGVGPA